MEQLTDLALGLDDAVTIGLQSVGVTPRASDARYATVQVLSTEARILDLAARGRRGGYGQVPHSALMPLGREGICREGRLDRIRVSTGRCCSWPPVGTSSRC